MSGSRSCLGLVSNEKVFRCKLNSAIKGLIAQDIYEFLEDSPELAQQLHIVGPLDRLLRNALELLLWSQHGGHGPRPWVAFRWERESEAKTASHKCLLFF